MYTMIGTMSGTAVRSPDGKRFAEFEDRELAEEACKRLTDGDATEEEYYWRDSDSEIPESWRAGAGGNDNED